MIKDFVLGEAALPTPGPAIPQERKSPPLSALTPHRDRYLQVDPRRHYDPAHLDAEWDKLWTRLWLCAGRVSDLPKVGSWLRFDFVRESFIVSRSAEDKITAMYNVCPHRGNRLVDGDFGQASAFVCPYHSWTFGRDGKCRSITDREYFKEAALAGRTDLKPVRCETYGGFIFVNMDENAAPLLDYLGDVPANISNYDLETLTVRADVMVDMPANWKTILDAFSENYHVHMTHVVGALLTEDRRVQMDFYRGGHSRRITPVGVHNGRGGPAGKPNEAQLGMLQGAGVEPATFTGTADDVRPAVQAAKRRMNGAAGRHFAKLADGQLTDDWAMNIFPNMHWDLHAEGVLMMRYYPHRTDPERCTLHIIALEYPGLNFDYYLPVSPERDAFGRARRQHITHDNPDISTVIGLLLSEDMRNTREVQQGLRSRAFDTIRLSEHEQVLMHQYAEIDRYLEQS